MPRSSLAIVRNGGVFVVMPCLIALFLSACGREHHLESGRPVTATVLLERGFARQVSSRQYQINDQVAQDPQLRDAHTANPAVYYPRTQAALIAGPSPGSDAYWRQPLAWGNNSVQGLIPADLEVHFAVELSGGRIALAELGSASLGPGGLGELHIRLTSEHRDAIYLGDFLTTDLTPGHTDAPARTLSPNSPEKNSTAPDLSSPTTMQRLPAKRHRQHPIAPHLNNRLP
jgi:hypothetical protein